MTEKSPFDLNETERQAFGEYITRQQKKGRTEIGMGELAHVIEAIQVAFQTFGPVR